jgi:phosphoglycolate phosphatase
MNVLLDLDGTLTDPKQGIVGCIQHALACLGHVVPEESALLKYIGPPLHAAFRELLPVDQRSDTERAVAQYRERYAAIGMFENSVYPGVPAALELLRSRGARLFLATSKPGVYARRILDHFELSRYFEAVYGSELDGTRADKTDLLAHVLASSQLHRSNTTMVGDRRHDALGAIANGVRAVGVLWGYGCREELLGAGVDLLLETPSELGCLAFNNATRVTSDDARA